MRNLILNFQAFASQQNKEIVEWEFVNLPMITYETFCIKFKNFRYLHKNKIFLWISNAK